MSDPHTLTTLAEPLIRVGMSLPEIKWPYLVSLTRLSLALALGLLIGLERERRGKEAGLRTFSLIALLGAMGGTLGDNYAYLILFLTGVLTVFLNIQRLRTNDSSELTTSAAMLITCVAGILCGKGHTATPASIIVMVTALLAWKDRLTGFSLGLTENEMRSALLLAILAIVIYPALPVGAIGPWNLIEPRAAWVTVILIAGIGFVNYVLWKMYGTRGIVMAGFLGGLVNSSVTVSELASRAKDNQGETVSAAYRGILLATAAMIIRNGALLVILAPSAALNATIPFVLMLALNAGWFFFDANARQKAPHDPSQQVDLPLPFALGAALKYGLVFLLLHIAGVVAQQNLGEMGFYAVSLIGGMVSSASAVAAAASLVTSGSVPTHIASTGAVIASLASVLINLPLVLRAHNRKLTLRLSVAMLSISIVGIVGAFLGNLCCHLWQRDFRLSCSSLEKEFSGALLRCIHNYVNNKQIVCLCVEERYSCFVSSNSQELDLACFRKEAGFFLFVHLFGSAVRHLSVVRAAVASLSICQCDLTSKWDKR